MSSETTVIIHGSPWDSVAFSIIRTLAFAVIVVALLEAAFQIVEIPIDHIRRLNYEGGASASFWAGSGFRFRAAFGSTVVGLSLVPFWMFTGRIAHAISRPFQVE